MDIIKKQECINILEDIIKLLKKNDTLGINLSFRTSKETIPFETFEAEYFIRYGNSEGQGCVFSNTLNDTYKERI